MKSLLLILLILPVTVDAQRVISGYVTYWDLNMKIGSANFGNMPYDSLRTGIFNHYIVFAAGCNSYGYLTSSSAQDGICLWGTAGDGIKYQQRGMFNNWLRRKQPSAKIDLCFFLSMAGGPASGVVASPKFRAQLVKTIDSTLGSMEGHGGYDGVVLDCEPFAAGDTANMRFFLSALHFTLHPKGKTIGVNFGTEYDFWGSVQQYVDYFYPMLYDLTGTWTERQWHNSPVYTNGAKAMSGWDLFSINTGKEWMIHARIPRSKIVLPIDFNGYVWQGGVLSGSSPTDGIHDTLAVWSTVPTKVQWTEVRYYDLLKNWITPNAAIVRHDIGRGVPFIGINNPGNGNDYFVTYQDTTTIRKVIQLADSAGLGGVFIWDIAGGWLNAASYPSTYPRDPLLRQVEQVSAEYGWNVTAGSPAPGPKNRSK